MCVYLCACVRACVCTGGFPREGAIPFRPRGSTVVTTAIVQLVSNGVETMTAAVLTCNL